MTAAEPAFVFGYGSLIRDPAEGTVCRLRGHRRTWDVAMDNTRDLPGYKFYVDAETGERPALYVAFLDVRPDEACAVNGVAYPVLTETLPLLDARERNYERRDVTELMDADLGGRVWTYVGSDEGRARYAEGFEAGTAVVSQEYYDGVREGVERLGPEVAAEYEASTDPLEVPLRALRRVDLDLAAPRG